MKKNTVLFTLLMYAVMINLNSCSPGNKANKELKRDGAVINYQVSGTGDTTLLLVHGSYIDQTYWKAQVDHFKNRYRVVTLDLPGHGLSGKERQSWTIKGFADDVNYLVQELELKNVILVGHSLGADIGLVALTSQPGLYKGFIAVDFFKNAATPLPEEQVNGILGQLKADFVKTNEQYVRMALATPQTPPAVADRAVADFKKAYEPMGQQIMPEFFNFSKTEKELLPKLEHKLYVISVDYMPANEEPLRQYATHGYKLLHMPGTSHFPMIENPAALNELMQHCIDDMGK